MPSIAWWRIKILDAITTQADVGAHGAEPRAEEDGSTDAAEDVSVSIDAGLTEAETELVAEMDEVARWNLFSGRSAWTDDKSHCGVDGAGQESWEPVGVRAHLVACLVLLVDTEGAGVVEIFRTFDFGAVVRAGS